MAKDKRGLRRAMKEWRHGIQNADTDPAACRCGHEGMAAGWHGSQCDVWLEAWAAKPGG